MIRNTLNQIDYALCAEIALLLFAGVFIAVSVRAFLTDRKTAQAHASMILHDDEEGEQ